MRKSVQIYKIDDKLYYVPMYIVSRIERMMITPIAISEFNNYEIANQLIASLALSSSGMDNLPESGFKELLKVTKTKSNIRLVTKASAIAVEQNENILELELLYGDTKNKSFNAYKPNIKYEFDLSINTKEELGNAIVALFNLANN